VITAIFLFLSTNWANLISTWD